MPHADRSLSIEVPWRTLLKLVAAVALVWLWTQLWDIVLVFVLTMYLLLEGRRTRDWLVAFVPHDKRSRMERTLAESQEAMFAYVAGNIATSVFAFVFVFVVLSILKVPAALLLAIVAGVCDF